MPAKRLVDIVVHQLDVSGRFADVYDGYSGSAILDRTKRAVITLLVQQKTLRIWRGTKEATSTLFAVPIEDALNALDVDIPLGRPLRALPALASTVVDRQSLRDEIVGSLLQGIARCQVVSGPVGAGKSTLAHLVARDERIWQLCHQGVAAVEAGDSTYNEVERRLREPLHVSAELYLKDALDDARLLLVVDDVRSREIARPTSAEHAKYCPDPRDGRPVPLDRARGLGDRSDDSR